MIEILVSNYGPIAFGLVSVLIIWYAIVTPILKQNKVDTTTLSSASRTLKETVVILERITLNLNQAITRLERLENENKQ